jgi:tRNA-specific 2-thiouridylase
MLRQEQLRKIVFPLGILTKSQVRILAKEAGFPELVEQNESQDFLEGSKYDILFNDNELKDGNIIDEQGYILGKHHGIIHYTIGQRKGLGIGGAEEPYYVIGLDPIRNCVIVGPPTLPAKIINEGC